MSVRNLDLINQCIDRPCYSVCSNRRHLAIDAIRPYKSFDFVVNKVQQCRSNSRFCQNNIPMLLNGSDNYCPFPLGNWTGLNLIHGSTWDIQPNGIWIGTAVLAWHTNVTSRQTDKQTNTLPDHATPSVAISRIWLLLQCAVRTDKLT